MKKAIVILLIIVLAAGISWQIQVRYKARQQAGKGGRGGGAVAVELAPVTHRTLSDTRTFTGTLEAQSSVTVAPKVAGRLAKLSLQLGDTVQPGQEIAVLDAEEYNQSLAQANAALDVAQANADEVRLQASLDEETARQHVAQAEADLAMAHASQEASVSDLEAAKREYERAKALREKEIASSAELDAAQDHLNTQEAASKVQRAEVTRMEAALQAAKVAQSQAQIQARAAGIKHADALVAQQSAAVKAAEIQVGYTTLKANWPETEGTRVVGERLVDPGTQLKANDPILTLLDLRTLTAVTYFTESDYSKALKDVSARLSTDAYPDRTFAATVARVAPRMDVGSRQARIEFAAPNPDLLLRPGMFVRLSVEFAKHENATAVPVTALIRRDGVQGVFVADRAAGKAHFVPVQVGVIDGELAEILSPADLSGEVVTLGQYLLADGTAFKLAGGPGDKADDARGGKAEKAGREGKGDKEGKTAPAATSDTPAATPATDATKGRANQ